MGFFAPFYDVPHPILGNHCIDVGLYPGVFFLATSVHKV